VTTITIHLVTARWLPLALWLVQTFISDRYQYRLGCWLAVKALRVVPK